MNAETIASLYRLLREMGNSRTRSAWSAVKLDYYAWRYSVWLKAQPEEPS